MLVEGELSKEGDLTSVQRCEAPVEFSGKGAELVGYFYVEEWRGVRDVRGRRGSSGLWC